MGSVAVSRDRERQIAGGLLGCQRASRRLEPLCRPLCDDRCGRESSAGHRYILFGVLLRLYPSPRVQGPQKRAVVELLAFPKSELYQSLSHPKCLRFLD